MSESISDNMSSNYYFSGVNETEGVADESADVVSIQYNSSLEDVTYSANSSTVETSDVKTTTTTYSFDLSTSTVVPAGTVLDPAIWNNAAVNEELIASGLVTRGADGSLTVTSDTTMIQGTITSNGVTYPVALAGDANGNMQLFGDFNNDGVGTADELFTVKLSQSGTVEFYDKANGTLIGTSADVKNDGKMSKTM